MLTYSQRIFFKYAFHQNTMVFIQENIFENIVCKKSKVPVK